MTRRIKLFIMLIIVMCLIYVQQSFAACAVTYGADTVQSPETEKDQNTAKEEIKQAPEDQGGTDEDNCQSGEEGSKDSEGSGDESSSGEGNGDGGGSGEGSGEDSGGGDGDGDNSGNDKPPVEEKVIEKYEVDIPPENGEHGYYTKKPEIVISHISEAGVTKYYVKHGDKKTEERSLEKKGDKAVIGGKNFSEGKNILHIWMEDEKGEKLEKYELKKEILIDSKAPDIEMSVPKGFDTWYQGKVMLYAKGEDTGSKGVKLTCKVGGRTLENAKVEKGEFEITQTASQGNGAEVTIIAKDKAGNKSEKVKTVYIDNEAPKVKIKGAKNYSITGKTVNLTCEAEEENVLQEFFAEVVWENVKGKKKKLSQPGWEPDGRKWVFQKELKKDGVYHIKVHAKDMAGHISEDVLQVIVDKANPIIRYVGTLEGQYLKSFRWTYPPRVMIQDLTTYTYEMKVDGQLYHMGKTIDSEGRHKMEVKATDAAGNRAKAVAEFVIDHTAPQIIFDNVKEGESYEEERNIKVELKGTEDSIEKIQINGESQKIYPGRTAYEYALHECKDYEIVVNARDRAGNKAEKKIYFSIVPKETFAEKITEPVKTYFSVDRKDKTERDLSKEERSTIKETGKNKRIPLKVAGMAGVGIFIIAGGICYRYVYKRKSM